jgi:predicted O-methyltransferase YrrM
MVYVPWRQAALTDDGPLIYTSVTAEETEELMRLSAGRRCLEIGSAFGYSACAMSVGGAVGITAVDPHLPHVTNEFMSTLGEMSSNLVAYGVSEVNIMQCLSEEALPELVSSGEQYGLIFIDADHDEDPVRHDVAWARKLVAPSGAIACHDYGNDNTPGVQIALDDIFPAGPTRLVHSLWVLET